MVRNPVELPRMRGLLNTLPLSKLVNLPFCLGGGVPACNGKAGAPNNLLRAHLLPHESGRRGDLHLVNQFDFSPAGGRCVNACDLPVDISGYLVPLALWLPQSAAKVA